MSACEINSEKGCEKMEDLIAETISIISDITTNLTEKRLQRKKRGRNACI